MNVIPIIPKAGETGPPEEPVRRASRGIEIEDMTPPMHRTGSTGPDIERAAPTGNQIAAMVADAVARMEVNQIAPLQQQIDRIFEDVDRLAGIIDPPAVRMPYREDQAEPVHTPYRESPEPGVPMLGHTPDEDAPEPPGHYRPPREDAAHDETGYGEPGKAPTEPDKPEVKDIPEDAAEDPGDKPTKALKDWIINEIELRLRQIEEAAGALPSVYGDPSLYKGIFLRGWKRDDSDAEWEPMTVEEELANPPTLLESEVGDGLTCLRWTWDWQRIQP